MNYSNTTTRGLGPRPRKDHDESAQERRTRADGRSVIAVGALVVRHLFFPPTPLATATTAPPPVGHRPAFDTAFLNDVGIAIRSAGYHCLRVDAAAFVKRGPYGNEARVECDTGTFQVIAISDEHVRIRPWHNRLR